MTQVWKYKGVGELYFGCNFPPLRKSWNFLAFSEHIEGGLSYGM